MGKRGRREHILDQMFAENGARVAKELRAQGISGLSDKIKALDDAKRKDFDTVVKELRKVALGKNLDRELAQHILQDPVSSILGRITKLQPHDISRPSKTAALVGELAGKKKPKPHLAVISPQAVADVVDRIKAITNEESHLARGFADLGLSVEDGTWLMFSVLDYSKALSNAGIQRRIDRRGGILYETLLPRQPHVVQQERVASATNATEWIRSEPGRFGSNSQQAEQLANSVSDRLQLPSAKKPSAGSVFIRDRNGAGFGELEPLAPNLWFVRLTEVRDESGRLMSDHIGTLMSFTPDRRAIELMPSGFGESKFKSGYDKIVPQLLKNLRRASETLRASNLPDLKGLEIRVRWGKTLVVIIQSEKALPEGSLKNIQTLVRKATRAPNMRVLESKGATPEQALAARRVVQLFMKLATDPRQP